MPTLRRDSGFETQMENTDGSEHRNWGVIMALNAETENAILMALKAKTGDVMRMALNTDTEKW